MREHYAFLESEDASYMTGQVLYSNSGTILHDRTSASSERWHDYRRIDFMYHISKMVKTIRKIKIYFEM